MKEKEYKMTFKKGKRSTGLSAIGEGTPRTVIKYKGLYFGYIAFNDSWNSKNEGITVRFRKKDVSKKCGWVWAKLKTEFKNEEEARLKVQELKNQLISIAFFDDYEG